MDEIERDADVARLVYERDECRAAAAFGQRMLAEIAAEDDPWSVSFARSMAGQAADTIRTRLNGVDAMPSGITGYPHESGDVIAIGPGAFARRDRAVLNWEGVNYVIQADPITVVPAGGAITTVAAPGVIILAAGSEFSAARAREISDAMGADGATVRVVQDVAALREWRPDDATVQDAITAGLVNKNRQLGIARTYIEDLEAESDGARDALRQLAAAVTGLSRNLYAAWIEALGHRDPDAAGEILTGAIAGCDVPKWNGTETGREWLERTRGAAPAPYGVTVEDHTWHAIVRQGGRFVAGIAPEGAGVAVITDENEFASRLTDGRTAAGTRPGEDGDGND